MSEYIVRERSYTLLVETNKRTIHETFTNLRDFLSRVKELADEGLQPDPRGALDDVEGVSV